MLTQAKETAGSNYHDVKLPALINDKFGDTADLFIFVVENIEPD